MRKQSIAYLPRRGPGNVLYLPTERTAQLKTEAALQELAQIENMDQFAEVCRRQASRGLR